MNARRPQLLAIVIAIAYVLSIQSASALVTTNATPSETTCDSIGPQPSRLATLGVGVNTQHMTVEWASMGVPACYEAELPDDSAAIDEALRCDTAGPTALRLMPVSGLGVSGSVTGMAVPACMISANLLQPAEEIDNRICNPNGAIVTLIQPCTSPD